ncbi:aryl-alcohol oxidase-like protein [Mycena crocata]|nr:aryl-alcohol oxidase-like protein [Mycena crocata]
MAFPLLLVVFSVVNLCLGKIFTAPSQVTSKTYDFIIVGAGTAGSVIAARITENPSVKVLVIEAGGMDNGTLAMTIYAPLLAGTGLNTAADWNFTTTPQTGLNGRTLGYPRGHVIGGSSAINGMIYSRGSSEEFDRIAAVSGDSGWSWASLQKYVMKNEKHTAPWNNRSNLGEFNPQVHGTGPVLTGLTPTVFETDRRVIQTTKDLPNKFPFNLDLNSGNGLGFGWLHTSVGKGDRTTSASAYLHPALNSRSNLDLLIDTQVTKLVSTSGARKFKGVRVSQKAGATTYSFTASKEVILSAGSVGTPQLLMLSGITTALDLPDVGNNLHDQTILAMQWKVNTPTLSTFLNDGGAVGDALGQWATNKTGPAAGNTIVNTIGFLRLPSNSALLKAGDPAAGPKSPHFQLSFLNTFFPNAGQVAPTTGNWMSVSIVVQSTTSVGSISITSNSAFTYPTINPAYYTTAFDIGTAVQAIKTLREFLAGPAWGGMIIESFPDCSAAALNTDAKIEAYVRKFADTVKHPTGTARISKASEKGGVVGPDLLVKGASGLRIVDASVLPAAIAGFPQAEVYIIAERAADIIKKAWSL